MLTIHTINEVSGDLYQRLTATTQDTVIPIEVGYGSTAMQ